MDDGAIDNEIHRQFGKERRRNTGFSDRLPPQRQRTMSPQRNTAPMRQMRPMDPVTPKPAPVHDPNSVEVWDPYAQRFVRRPSKVAKVHQSENFKKTKLAQDMPPPGGAPAGPPPPKKPKNRRFKHVTDEPEQFDNSSVAPTENHYLNPVNRTKGKLRHKHINPRDNKPNGHVGSTRSSQIVGCDWCKGRTKPYVSHGPTYTKCPRCQRPLEKPKPQGK